MPRSLRGHCIRTARYAAVLYAHAQHSDGLTHTELAVCSYLCDHPALMQAHDIGKCFLPQELLEKPGKLSGEEMALMRLHPLLGAALLQPAGREEADGRYAQQLILLHHERWDGKGYPYGFAGQEIPFSAALLSIADAYDAMTAGRPYQPAKSHQEAWREIVSQAGRQFNPAAVSVFRRAAASFERLKKEAGHAARHC